MTRHRGFTLLEVMIASSIAAIGIVSLLELFSGSIHLARMATRQTEAMSIASMVLDQVLWRADFDDGEEVGSIEDFTYVVSIQSIEPQLGMPEQGLGEREEATEEYELKEIAVTVSWPTPGGAKSVSVASARLMENF